MQRSPAALFVLLLIPAAAGTAASQTTRPPVSHAVFKSTDRGRSWHPSHAGIPADSRINAFGAAENVIFAGTDSGIFRSRDEGETWAPAAGATAIFSRVTSFAAVGRRVYSGTDDGLLVSPDQGMSWTGSAGFPSRQVRCLLGHRGKLFAGTDAEGVFVTEDNGVHWTRLGQGLPHPVQVFAMSALDNVLFAGLYANGLYRWRDQDQRWTKTGTVRPLVLAAARDTLIAGHNPGGIHWSADLGTTWSPGQAGDPIEVARPMQDGSSDLTGDAAVWQTASDDSLVIAGAAAGIYRSEDQGRTWVRARGGLPAEATAVSFLVRGSLVLAGTSIKSAGGN